MSLFAGSAAVGRVDGIIDMAVNTNTVLGAGEFCQPGFETGDIDCSTNTGFGPSLPVSVLVLSGIPFDVQAGSVIQITGPNDTDLMGVSVDWLGVVVGNINGTRVMDDTVASGSCIGHPPESVPEPSPARILVLGVCGLCMAVRRRAHDAAIVARTLSGPATPSRAAP